MQKIPRDLEAAIVLPDGLVYTGTTHGDAMLKALEDGWELPDDTADLNVFEGFDSKALGFVTRGEAETLWDSGESCDLAEKRHLQKHPRFDTIGRCPCGAEPGWYEEFEYGLGGFNTGESQDRCDEGYLLFAEERRNPLGLTMRTGGDWEPCKHLKSL